ncbi:MAG: hypothetical protein KTR26_01935 [Flammeovirgaceae bacterium]|nr:hypothetical protein [Flammeovirgaceae bacterium]
MQIAIRVCLVFNHALKIFPEKEAGGKMTMIDLMSVSKSRHSINCNSF